jgi:hypothetical protein
MLVPQSGCIPSAERDDPTCVSVSTSTFLLAHGRTLGTKGEVMSRDLPVHANIDHLKKQAKERLIELRHGQPRAKLADAQHEIARLYGFASWPKLRAYVDSGQNDLRFDRFTAKARQALFFSRYEASQLGSLVIEPEHVLLGLVRAGQALEGGVLARAGLSFEATRAEIAPASPVREPLDSSVMIPFSDLTSLVLRAAAAEADRLVHDRVGIAHVVLGLLRAQESVAASILRNSGIESGQVRQGLPGSLADESA